MDMNIGMGSLKPRKVKGIGTIKRHTEIVFTLVGILIFVVSTGMEQIQLVVIIETTILNVDLYHTSVCGHRERTPMTEFAGQLIVHHAHTQAVDVFVPHDALQVVWEGREDNV